MPFYERPVPKYRDREDAGRVLASRLLHYKDQDLIVIAIPNGGVPVGSIIARELHAKLSLMIVRKLQIPNNPEAGFGALTSDGFLLLNHDLIRSLGISEEDIRKQKENALKSIQERQEYFGERGKLHSLQNRSVILVDDGLASGFTMEAAVKSVKSMKAESILIAVPTSSMSAYRRLESQVDRIVCPDLSRTPVFAVANAYKNWYDLDEAEVLDILNTLPGRESN
ncbi:MAG: phosphoribosyltransferase family protein [Thermodesulfobacteriota bacterium]|nr:phosphoribosyltransferase family protein [Thermodesulfobacteriota bacterium]